jgi:hypothetical protein
LIVYSSTNFMGCTSRSQWAQIRPACPCTCGIELSRAGSL